MKLSELPDREDGIVEIGGKVHISELDRYAGKVIRFMAEEMPELTASHAMEVLHSASWWVQYAAYSDFGAKVEDNPDYIKNSFWRNIKGS